MSLKTCKIFQQHCQIIGIYTRKAKLKGDYIMKTSLRKNNNKAVKSHNIKDNDRKTSSHNIYQIPRQIPIIKITQIS